MPSISDLFGQGSNGTMPLPTTLASQKLSGATSMSLSAATGWPTATVAYGLLYQVDAAGKLVPGTVLSWKGILSGTTVGSLVIRGGTDSAYPAGSIVEIALTDAWADDLMTGILTQHNQDGSHALVQGLTNNQPITQKDNAGTPRAIAEIDNAGTLHFGNTTTPAKILGGNAGTNGHTVPNVADTNLAVTDQASGNPSAKLFYNPYKFSVYRSAALTPAGGFILFDTKEFDTGTNYSTSTGKFTAPVAGFYFFTAQLRWLSTAQSQNFGTVLRQNGSTIKEGDLRVQMYNGITSIVATTISCMLNLAANDYVQVSYVSDGEALSVANGLLDNYFQGFLVSAT